MARDHEHDALDQSSKTPSAEGRISRRDVLAAGGLVAAAAGLVERTTVTAKASGGGLVGENPAGGTAVEFRARFAQTGEHGEEFVGYGYLTAAHGATDDDLFAAAQQNESTATLTAYAAGQLVRRTTDQAVHALDVEGTLTIYQRPGPGASFADPGSFAVGTPVARFAITLQDIVTVFAPGQGFPVLNGDMRQTLSDQLGGPGGQRFGHVGARARLYATGIGRLVDPGRLNSVLEMAGNWTTK